MKFVLYICLFFLHTISSEVKDHYDLLLNPYELGLSLGDDFDIEDGMEGFSAVRFEKTNSVSIPIEKVSLKDVTLSSPFILYTVFKLDDLTSSCLFSIVDKDVKLGLCLTLASENITRITLDGEGIPNKFVEFTYMGSITVWTKMLLHVDKTKVTLYLNCLEIDTSVFKSDVGDIHFSKDATLNLGHSGGGNFFFKGVIQEIKIHTNADEDKLKHTLVCTDVPILPSSTDSGDYGEDYTPENLELFTDSDDFTDAPPITREKGDKGEKGDRGDARIGPQGLPGPQGPPGSPGKNGKEGTCACSESVVSSLLKKMPEMRGPPGEPGHRGDIGDPGAPGLTGKQGDQGERGPPGLKGENGGSGDDGSPGRDGSPGPKGEPGKDGAPGPMGLQGLPGPPGPAGPMYKETEEAKEVTVPGEKGDQGPVGPPGSPGPQGIQGEKGELGNQGNKGNRGHTGPEGPRGEKGERGDSGRDGIPGESGAHGRPAEKAEKGDRGDKGTPGLPGLPATLFSLLDPEMDPVENAAIVEKLRGHKGEAGTAGEKGERGDIGPVGPPGPPGKDGRHGSEGKRGPEGHKGDQGPIGHRGHKGEPGSPGPPGNLSASDSTIVKGPKGEKGDRGPPGKIGSRGPIGHNGKRGPTGSSGPKGDKGNTGDQGPVGQSGIRGDKGSTGEKGERGESVISSVDMKKLKGDKGDRGNDGRPGEPGKPGVPGQCPDACAISVQGPPGPPGTPGISVTGPKGEPGGILSQKTIYSFTDGSSEKQGNSLDDDDDFYSALTVVYRTITALIKHTPSTPLGTLAYVLREKTLLLRVENGWQYVVMGSIIEANDQYTTTTVRPLPSHFESSTSASNAKRSPSPERAYRFRPDRPSGKDKPCEVVTPYNYYEANIEIDKKIRLPYSHQLIGQFVWGGRNVVIDFEGGSIIRLIALNEPYPGNMVSFNNRTGRSSADYACLRQSRNYGANGNFVAFLANKVEDLRNLVKVPHDKNLPVVNMFGEVLFRSWEDMFNGTGATLAKSANIYSFSRKNVLIDPTWPQKAVWHGSNMLGIRSPQVFCEEWQSDSTRHFGVATSLTNYKLLGQDMHSCDNKLIVLCVEATASRRRQRHLSSRARDHFNKVAYENRIPRL